MTGWADDILLQCPKCGHVEDIQGYDVLGADPGNLFCNQCNFEGVMIDVPTEPTAVIDNRGQAMQTAKFYGASDDLIEVEGIKGGNEFNVIADGPHMASFNLGGKMRVHAIYDGCWSFAPAMVDESIPLPDWPIRVKQEGYTTVLEIDVPDDVKVFHERKQ